MSDITRFRNIHKGETCVIIGNGPSLNNTPLKQLSQKYMTFGSNKIYRLPFEPDYYSVIDKEMLETCTPFPPNFRPIMFLRAESRVTGNNPIYPIVAAGFSLDINNFVVMGGTVTFALLQIAFYMGFKTALLVGVDHNYPGMKNVAPGSRFVAGEDDNNHFSPMDGRPYFETGKTFNAPELENTEKSYSIAREVYEKTGRRIVNLTPGTKLNVFEKDSLQNWL